MSSQGVRKKWHRYLSEMLKTQIWPPYPKIFNYSLKLFLKKFAY